MTVDMLSVMASTEAKSAYDAGWSLDEIRSFICVECGSIEIPNLTSSGAEVPERIGGRKIGYCKDGRRFDAGRICGDCMLQVKTKKEVNNVK